MADAGVSEHTLKEGDAVDIRARVRCVVDSDTGHVFVRVIVDDPPGRGGWTEFRVPIEACRRPPEEPDGQHDLSDIAAAMGALRQSPPPGAQS